MNWFYKQLKWKIKWYFLKFVRASNFLNAIASVFLMVVTLLYVEHTKRIADITHDQFIQNSIPELSIYSGYFPEVIKSNDTLLLIPLKNFSKFDLVGISGGVSIYCYIINHDGSEGYVELSNIPDEHYISEIISLKAGESDTLHIDIRRYRGIEYEHEDYHYISSQLGGSGEWRKMRLLQHFQCLLGKIILNYHREIDGKMFKKTFCFTSIGGIPKVEDSGYFVVDGYDETINMWRKFSRYFLNKEIWKRLQQEAKKAVQRLDSFKTK